MVFGQKLEFCFFLFFKQIGQKEVFCNLLDRTLAILDYKNIEFNTWKIGTFPKRSKFGMFVRKMVRNKVFCDLLDRKPAI